MGSLQADENQRVIQVIGPRGVSGRHRVQGASNAVQLQPGYIYRVVSEYDFHFRLTTPGDAAVIQDEVQPGMTPMFFLTNTDQWTLHHLAYATNGWLWITLYGA